MNDQTIVDAMQILKDLGMPRGQQNERSALCLLALLNLTPDKTWYDVEAPLLGITPIMDWSRDFYSKEYAPNTRETFRRQSMHQFVESGIALQNPDNPSRPINSPKTVYQIEPSLLEIIKTFGTKHWSKNLKNYLSSRQTLIEQYAKRRKQELVPVRISPESEIDLSPGEHSELIKLIIENFAPRFVPGAELVYVGDTGEKWGYFNEKLLSGLGVTIDSHGKMPDVVLYYQKENWLILIESVTSHGPVDGKRHGELAKLFSSSTAGTVFVTAFPSRSSMARYLSDLAWETEVWIAENPSHLIHFDGERFLGPYE